MRPIAFPLAAALGALLRKAPPPPSSPVSSVLRGVGGKSRRRLCRSTLMHKSHYPENATEKFFNL